MKAAHLFPDSPKGTSAFSTPSNNIKISRLKLGEMKQDLSSRSIDSDAFSDVVWDPVPSQTCPNFDSSFDFSHTEQQDADGNNQENNGSDSREEKVRSSAIAPDDELAMLPSRQEASQSDNTKDAIDSPGKGTLKEKPEGANREGHLPTIFSVDSNESTTSDSEASPNVSETTDGKLPDSPTSVAGYNAGTYGSTFSK
eukprot:15326460-Ditylum_brightwellii.AAC.1